MNNWYAACLSEVSAFLDKFEHQKSAVVKVDSDLVAALVGILQGGQIVYLMAQHAQLAASTAALLETELKN